MRVDLHIHTAIGSPCSRLEPIDLVAQAIARGLDGIAVTDHAFSAIDLRGPIWAGYEAVRAAARGKNLRVFRGIECSFAQGDFLIFGFDEEQINTLATSFDLPTALTLARSRGGVVIQAHPLRWGGKPVEDADAYEAWNGGRPPEENQTITRWCREHGKIAVAGSDAHAADEVGRTFTEFAHPIESEEDLCTAIRNAQITVFGPYKPRT